MTWSTEFPDFPAADLPEEVKGWCDLSWRNDSCPAFMAPSARYMVFIDYTDEAKREWPGIPRFVVNHFTDGAVGGTALATDDWSAVLKLIDDDERE